MACNPISFRKWVRFVTNGDGHSSMTFLVTPLDRTLTFAEVDQVSVAIA